MRSRDGACLVEVGAPSDVGRPHITFGQLRLAVVKANWPLLVDLLEAQHDGELGEEERAGLRELRARGDELKRRRPPRRRVRCKFCGLLAPVATAHRHDGGWVGDDCCWDERLRSTE